MKRQVLFQVYRKEEAASHKGLWDFLFLTSKNNADSIKKSICPQYVIKVGPKPTNYSGTKPELVGFSTEVSNFIYEHFAVFLLYFFRGTLMRISEISCLINSLVDVG